MAALLVIAAGADAERHDDSAERCRCGPGQCALHRPAAKPSCHAGSGHAPGHGAAPAPDRAGRGATCALLPSCGHVHGAGAGLQADGRAVLPGLVAFRPDLVVLATATAPPPAPRSPARPPEPPPPRAIG